jgi:hypothetical protein
VLQSGFFRQLYEAAFNAPSELSAAVALESIYKIFSKQWHYYFNSPTRESIIIPLLRHFTQWCRGRIEFEQKLVKVRTDDAGLRVKGLVFENLAIGHRYSVQADEYILALGLEDFKLVDFGAVASQHDYFRNVHKLQTVSSFSIQAWFNEDPVPPGIDSMITGMPEPFGILCPITRVRATRPLEELPLRYEVIATGPERGYEDIPDDEIEAAFIQGLRGAGFRIPGDPAQMHVVLRRNRESSHRYLLTRPGELHLRPPHQSPLENLCLAGAWVRNEFALPCVDAAAEGAIKVAQLISGRVLAPRGTAGALQFAAVPCGDSLVPPPYRFPCSTGSFFLLDANSELLSRLIPSHLNLFPGLGGKVVFAALRHEDVHALWDKTGARYQYSEVLLAAFVRRKGRNPISGIGLYPIHLFVDDQMAMAVGREVYGFPKTIAHIELGAHEMRLVCSPGEPGSPTGLTQQTTVMSARWSARRRAGRHPEAHSSIVSHALNQRLARSALGKLAQAMLVYNIRRVVQPGSGAGTSHELIQLTKVAPSDVDVRHLAQLNDLRLRVDASIDDPVHLLLGADREPAEIRSQWGVKVELKFSMGAARIVETGNAAHTIHAIDQMLRGSRGPLDSRRTNRA